MRKENIIELDNHKYVVTNERQIEINPSVAFIDITNKNSYSKLNKNSNVILSIDFESVKENEYPKLIRRIKRVINKCTNRNITIGYKENENNIIGVLYNYNKDNDKHQDVLISINAMLYKDIKKRYNYLYDKICEYLDNQFINKNLCGFENDRCVPRKHVDCNTGCCHHFKNKFFRYDIL